MRAQMSLELMLYASLAGLSFVFVLGAAAKGLSRISSGAEAIEASGFADTLNAALLAGGTTEFSAFVPRGMCNATVSGPVLSYGAGRLYLAEPLRMSGSPLCPDGGAVYLEVVRNGSGVYLRRA